MDVSQQPVSSEEKTRLYNTFSDLLLKGLDEEALTDADAVEAADFILLLDVVQTKQELHDFLQALANAWPIFQDEYVKYKKVYVIALIRQKFAQSQEGV